MRSMPWPKLLAGGYSLRSNPIRLSESFRYGLWIPVQGFRTTSFPAFSCPISPPKKNGNGLGLLICKHIVENHQGKIEVSSREGKGTSFGIHLPVKNLPETNDYPKYDQGLWAAMNPTPDVLTEKLRKY
ncbi:MAG: ATP-binding protein [Pseudomonadota bacterium]